MRWIYLSPHLDDAILSCGGLIYHQTQDGIPVEIWNLMSGTPSADAPLSELACKVHVGWGTASAKETLMLRLAEDHLAAQRVGATPRYFDFLDCIYRNDTDGTPLYTDDIFVPPHIADAMLIEQIAQSLRETLCADDVLVCPLTIGNHPDHVIVRDAVERTGNLLCYYADIPYAMWHPEQFTEIVENLSASSYPITEEEMLVWQDAIAVYASQIEVLFGTEEMMRTGIELYWQVNCGIQLWRPGE